MENAGSNQEAGPTDTDPSQDTIVKECMRIRRGWSQRRESRAKIQVFGRDKPSGWEPPFIRLQDCGIKAVEEIGND